MCGRFAFSAKGQFGYESLQVPEPPPFERYNIAPSQDILTIRTAPETGHPEWAMLRWGLVPFWSKEPGGKRPLINARAEGIEAKPSFRSSVRHRRCMVPASGFYEWRREGSTAPLFRPACRGCGFYPGRRLGPMGGKAGRGDRVRGHHHHLGQRTDAADS